MKLVVQKVLESSVTIDGKVHGKIDKGYMVLVGFCDTDTHEIIDKMGDKMIGLRIFEDENGKMHLSLNDGGGSILSISQFTLYADTKKGNRPSYVKALGGDQALPMYEKFNELLREHVTVETGIFGADMKVSIENNGPVTILLDTDERNS